MKMNTTQQILAHQGECEMSNEDEMVQWYAFKNGASDFYPKSGFDPRFDPDPIRKSGHPEGSNPDPNSKMLDPSKPDSDPDILIFKSGYPDPNDPNPNPDIRRILQFLEGYPTPGYPRTPDPDKGSKIMDPPDKDPNPDTLKLPGYPICPRPTYNDQECYTILQQKK
ncbi:hypothetical protein YC2023_060159 [Brassica napus]